jgi:mannan endo-1,4-beta-mannosidase
MNEPHTSDGFERARGIAPGTIMAAWVQEMASYFQGLDGAHLVSSGEEGYRVDGKPLVSDSDWQWMNSGLKGSDFIADCNDPNVDLCTIRGYPDNWNFSEDEYASWGDAFAADRAAVAHAAGKPIILEEYGMSKARYRNIPSREPVLRYLQDSARALGFAGTLVWAVDHERGADQDSGGYVFGPDGDGSKAVREQYAWARGQSGGAVATDRGGAVAAFASKEGGGGR